MRTPITYYGGKQSLLDKILPLIPEHDVYTEVYFGGGSVFFAKDPALNEVINDRLDMVVTFYRQLKFNYKKLKELIDSSLVSRTMHRQALQVLRRQDKYRPVTVAWAFWYCSNFSYMNKIGGGLKYSNDTSVIVPRVLAGKKRDFTEELVTRLENTSIENGEAMKVLKSHNGSQVFHFIDPPYVGADQGHYKGFKEIDIIDLFDNLKEIKGKFLLTHYPHPLLSEAVEANNWHLHQFTYNLKSPRKGNATKTECIVTNYVAAAEIINRPQLELFNTSNHENN